jgi:hypothetical protein
VFMRGSLHCCRDRRHGRGRGFAHAKPLVEVVRWYGARRSPPAPVPDDAH